MGRFITYEESPVTQGEYLLKLNMDEFPIHSTRGSYNVMFARLAGLSYANFLRMCRDEFGAEIRGKETKYPVAYFKLSKGLYAAVDFLNARARFLVYRAQHPYELIETEKEIKKIYDNGRVETVVR